MIVYGLEFKRAKSNFDLFIYLPHCFIKTFVALESLKGKMGKVRGIRVWTFYSCDYVNN
jgi:hypothetical protein